MARFNLFQAPAIFILEAFCEQLWGFEPNFIRPFVHQKGSVRSLFWFVTNMLKYEGILEKWGPVRTHFLTTALCTLNDCRYFAFGHAFSLELAYLKQTGRLFPLNERQLVELCGRSEAAILDNLEQALEMAQLSGEILGLQRMVELRHQRDLAATQQDRDLVHLTKMFAVLSVCGLQNDIRPDQAHAAINKNRSMRDRHFALRQNERAQATQAQTSGVTVLNPADLSPSPTDFSSADFSSADFTEDQARLTSDL